MNRTFDLIRCILSKFRIFRRMEESSQLLDYTKLNPSNTFIFDIDGTILQAHNRDYENAEPIQPMIDAINYLHGSGANIIFHTARGQLSKNGDMDRIERENRPVLEKWLEDHNVHYDHLLFNKPYGAWYIDDKALTPQMFLDNFNLSRKFTWKWSNLWKSKIHKK